jgi:hypothetical protein
VAADDKKHVHQRAQSLDLRHSCLSEFTERSDIPKRRNKTIAP